MNHEHKVHDIVSYANYVDCGESTDGETKRFYCRCGAELFKNPYSNGPRYVTKDRTYAY